MTPLDDYYGRDERITYLARHVMREAIHMPFAPQWLMLCGQLSMGRVIKSV